MRQQARRAGGKSKLPGVHKPRQLGLLCVWVPVYTRVACACVHACVCTHLQLCLLHVVTWGCVCVHDCECVEVCAY